MAVSVVRCKRFWVPRGEDPDLSDPGFLADPEEQRAYATPSSAVPLEALGAIPVLGLLGEPGMGKSTALAAEYERLKSTLSKGNERATWFDLGLFVSDSLLDQKVFKSPQFKVPRSVNRLHVFLDGLDECLTHVPTLVQLLLEFLRKLPSDRVSLRIACRTADWQAELESGLREVWGQDSVAIYELAPLRSTDVRSLVECRGCSPDKFLDQVDRIGVSSLASRPITLQLLLNQFARGEELPASRAALYEEGCRVLCDEWRESRSREQRLSSGLRLAIASRIAATLTFCGRTAIWRAPRHEPPANYDLRVDELLGGREQFDQEVLPHVELGDVRETLGVALFRSRGSHRLGFAHQTYAEFLAARYILSQHLPTDAVLKRVLHADGSGKVVPQLRATTAWLAAMRPDVWRAVIAKEPEAVLLSDTAPPAEEERAQFVRQILRAFESREMIDERLVWSYGKRHAGTRLQYSGLADDLRPYVRDDDDKMPIIVRRVAIAIADMAREPALQPDLLEIALNQDEPHEVRTVAVVALGRIGDGTAKEALKDLLKDDASDDPDDELRGGVLFATWPGHLTARELFAALTRRKRALTSGLYFRFLWSGFLTHIQPEDICVALDWAAIYIGGSPTKSDPLRVAAVHVVISAIPLYQKPGVLVRIADAFLALSKAPDREDKLAEALLANAAARRAVASIAISEARDLSTTLQLARAGLVVDDDIAFLLSHFEELTADDECHRLAHLVRYFLCGIPPEKLDCLDEIVALSRSSPIFGDVMQPLLAPVDWQSEEAEQLRNEYWRAKPSKVAACDEFVVPADELATILAGAEPHAFEYACCCLLGRDTLSQSRDEELLPHWSMLTADVQEQIVGAAVRYLQQECPIRDTAWSRRGELPGRVLFGFWALRLLGAGAPESFSSLPETTWREWMPCVFGDPYSEDVVDARHEMVLKAADRIARDRFLSVLSELIEGQNQWSGTIHVLDRLVPVWSSEAAELLRSKLSAAEIRPMCFRQVLSLLLERGDQSASQIAAGCLCNIPSEPDADVRRPVGAAMELLSRNPVPAWDAAWRVAEANETFAQELLAALEREVLSQNGGRMLEGLREDQLADAYIWLAHHGVTSREARQFGVVTDGNNLVWLGMSVMNHLVNRGTAEAYRQIGRIKSAAPGEPLQFASKEAAELVRRNTWVPLTPAQVIKLGDTTGPDPQSGPVQAGAYALSEPTCQLGRTDAPDRHLPLLPGMQPASFESPESREGAPVEVGANGCFFRKSGDFWNLKYGGTSVLVRNSKGMKYIAELLRCPDKEVHVSQLLEAVEGQGGKIRLGSAGTILDEQARKQYKARAEDLAQRLEEAKHNNDWGQKERIETELEHLAEQFTSAFGLGGRDRKAGDDAERLRKRVSRAITIAIKAIGKHHREVADHLRVHVKCGHFCSYHGDGFDWQL